MRDSVRTALRWTAAIFFTAAGANHFYSPTFYTRIVPPGFGDPLLMVQISGVCEMAGGVGLLIPKLRKAAGWGLIALLLAVFPANVYMAGWPEKIPGMTFPHWLLWARLPLQVVMMAWVWAAALAGGARRD